MDFECPRQKRAWLEGGQTAQSTNGNAVRKTRSNEGERGNQEPTTVKILEHLVRMPFLLPGDVDGWLPSQLL